jgi:uncharacterized protein YprB with RNaseH-like and TPR domain
MLQHTFQHIQGIGEKTEKRLWRAGVTHWLSFLDAPHHAPLPQGHRDAVCAELERSLRALERRDATYFTTRLAAQQHWRLYPEFGQRVAYVDIETTGGNAHTSPITVIGLYDGERPRAYVRGENLARFAEEVQDFTLLVTYNGTLFDLPVLRREFAVPLPPAHIDLRYPLAALGYRGGLKKIERRLGFEREGPVALLDGWCAVLLWHSHTRGEKGALATLLRYNLEDVIHLPALLAVVYNSRTQNLPFPIPPVTVPPAPPIPFGFDAPLIYRILAEAGRWPLTRPAPPEPPIPSGCP